MNNDIEKAIDILKRLRIATATSNVDGYRVLEPLTMAISALEEKLNGGWIPCNKKLPSSDGRFEVTVKGSRGKRYVEMCNFYKNAEFHKWGGKYNSFNVIAWRSRPEPYKEVDKVAKALGKFTDDINEHNPKALEEYTKDLTPFERKEFIELAEFSLMARQAFLKDKSLEVENE